MPRLSVYIPDDLAAEVRTSDLNVSAVTQRALRAELARGRVNRWLDDVSQQSPQPRPVPVADVLEAVRTARHGLGAAAGADPWPGRRGG